MSQASYWQILRSTSIIGGASVINIVTSLIRMKVAAVLLGPSGVGLIGLLTNLAGTASTIAGLGLGTVATRQIAEAAGRGDETAAAAAHRALFWATLYLALAGAFVFWLLREPLAAWVLGDAALAGDVGWLALVVVLTVAAGSQSALLNGLRRVGDLARVSIFSGMLATVVGVAALLLWGRSGLLVFVIAAPLASFMLGHLYVARLLRVQAPPTPLVDLAAQWRSLASMGAPFMLAGLVLMLGLLAVRSLVLHELGADAVGYYQAASAISTTYIGFVLGAMGTDYYPRLTAVIYDPDAVNRLVNEQTEVALLLAGPVLLAMMGLAPWVVDLLYSDKFYPAADILRWQILGDLLKLASWPLGFILLASGKGVTFMLSEALAVGAFVLLTALGLPSFGVIATGIAFFGMYLIYLPWVFWLAKKRSGFFWSKPTIKLIALLAVLLLGTLLARMYSVGIAAVFGVLSAGGFSLLALMRLGEIGGIPERIACLTNRVRFLLAKIGF